MSFCLPEKEKKRRFVPFSLIFYIFSRALTDLLNHYFLLVFIRRRHANEIFGFVFKILHALKSLHLSSGAFLYARDLARVSPPKLLYLEVLLLNLNSFFDWPPDFTHSFFSILNLTI